VDIVVNLNGGRDLLKMNNAGAGDGSPLRVERDLTIQAGDGDDEISLNMVAVIDDLFTDLGSGHDQFKLQSSSVGDLLDVRGGAGKDRVEVASSSLLRALFDLGADPDEIRLSEVTAASDVEIQTAGGRDQVTVVFNGFEKKLSIDTGADADEVALAVVVADSLSDQLGDGDGDYLYLMRTEAREAVLDGGAGSGDVLDLAPYFSLHHNFGTVSIAGFEIET